MEYSIFTCAPASRIYEFVLTCNLSINFFSSPSSMKRIGHDFYISLCTVMFFEERGTLVCDIMRLFVTNVLEWLVFTRQWIAVQKVPRDFTPTPRFWFSTPPLFQSLLINLICRQSSIEVTSLGTVVVWTSYCLQLFYSSNNAMLKCAKLDSIS